MEVVVLTSKRCASWLLLTILEFLSYKIFLNYRALGVWHFDPFFQWLCYGPFYILLGWEYLGNRKKEMLDIAMSKKEDRRLES